MALRAPPRCASTLEALPIRMSGENQNKLVPARTRRDEGDRSANRVQSKEQRKNRADSGARQCAAELLFLGVVETAVDVDVSRAVARFGTRHLIKSGEDRRRGQQIEKEGAAQPDSER